MLSLTDELLQKYFRACAFILRKLENRKVQICTMANTLINFSSLFSVSNSLFSLKARVTMRERDRDIFHPPAYLFRCSVRINVVA